MDKKPCVSLKPFTLTVDGITSRPVSPAQAVEVAADLYPGLKAEGFVRDFDPAKDKPAVKALAGAPENKAGGAGGPAGGAGQAGAEETKPIPDDWEDFGWDEKVDFVEALTGTKPKSKAEAVELVDAEKAKRAAAAEAAAPGQ